MLRVLEKSRAHLLYGGMSHLICQARCEGTWINSALSLYRKALKIPSSFFYICFETLKNSEFSQNSEISSGTEAMGECASSLRVFKYQNVVYS